jgi:hypothetical protein
MQQTLVMREPPVGSEHPGESGFSWVSDRESWQQRMSHALVSGGEVWIVDPSDAPGLDERILALGRPRAVIQLLDRHRRDGPEIARRLGVPLLENPETLPGSPFEPHDVPGLRGWRETALWWPEQRTLIVAEALGTARYYRAPGRRLGVHPLLRLVRPPKVLTRFGAERLLVGHGPSLEGDVAEQVRQAVRRARWELPLVVPRVLTARRPAGVKVQLLPPEEEAR